MSSPRDDGLRPKEDSSSRPAFGRHQGYPREGFYSKTAPEANRPGYEVRLRGRHRTRFPGGGRPVLGRWRFVLGRTRRRDGTPACRLSGVKRLPRQDDDACDRHLTRGRGGLKSDFGYEVCDVGRAEVALPVFELSRSRADHSWRAARPAVRTDASPFTAFSSIFEETARVPTRHQSGPRIGVEGRFKMSPAPFSGRRTSCTPTTRELRFIGGGEHRSRP